MDLSREHGRDAKRTEISLDHEIIQFDRGRYDFERMKREERSKKREKREAYRLERKEERKRQGQLGLENFKLMADVLTKK